MKNELREYYISRINFGVWNPAQIKQMAAVKIVTPELYDKEGYPVDGGLMDTRMGVVEPGLRCKTCGGRMKECPGHFGYMPLARPVINILFVNEIYSLLRSTCRNCGRILLDEAALKKYSDELERVEEEGGLEDRMATLSKIVSEIKRASKCPHCGTKQDKIKLEKPYTFLINGRRMNSVEIRSWLERIPDSDLKFFGLNPETSRPEWLILTIFPIPPVTVRPSITLESGEKSEDDLTHKLVDIVRINQRLFENINAGAPEIIVEDLWDLLQYHVATFYNNNLPKLPVARHRSGVPLKTLVDRISSKQGRIRHNLLGKRTNFSARTVISPDPLIEPDEVGVPYRVAMKLTVPQRVTEWNIEYLKEFIKRGPNKYPGANYLIRPDGKKKKITEETKEALLEEIQPGYVVERHLLDGDVVLFNRQPSLHRLSMMAHRVKVLDGLTFRINPAVCRPYNADFDGDEMNLHVPQTEEARIEAETMMLIAHQMISPRDGLTIIGAIQDAISGCYILTKRLTKIAKKEAIDLLANAEVFDVGEIAKKDFVSGKEVFSVLLPKDFNFHGKTKDKDEPELVIKNGKLIKGVLDKVNLGQGGGLLLRAFSKQYGPEATLKFMGRVIRLGIAVLMRYGFSIYVSDTDLPEEAKQKIQKLLEDAKKDCDNLIEQYRKGELEPYPGRTVEETLESLLLNRLNQVRNDAEDVVKETLSLEKNNTLLLALSGARGSLLNLIQMSSFVGQQALRGKRIDRGYSGRALSCFEKGDLSPEARGFIKNGFKQGLKPHEFFYAAMTGRDSLMDTALRTPKSGYLYRRLSNALTDLIVRPDGTIRNASGVIVQFEYGGDGVDVAKSFAGKVEVDSIIKSVVKGETHD